jgi:hypothetical protein
MQRRFEPKRAAMAEPERKSHRVSLSVLASIIFKSYRYSLFDLSSPCGKEQRESG